MSEETINDKSDFRNEVIKQCKLSFWCIWITILLMLANSLYIFTRAPMLYKGPQIKFRCEIPKLEDTNLTFEQIHDISQFNDSSCTYYKYNLKKLKERNYTDMKSLMNKPEIVWCEKYVALLPENYTTIFYDFELYCKKLIEHTINVSPIIGSIFGSCLSPFGDIYGRMSMLHFGLNFLAISIVFTNFMVVPDLYILVRFLSGIAVAVVNTTLPILVLELSSPNVATNRFLVVECATPALVYLTIAVLSSIFQNWRYIQWCCSIPLIFFPLIEYYIPESPQWLYTRKLKEKAWDLLKNLKEPEIFQEILTSIDSERWSICTLLHKHLMELRMMFSKDIWIGIIVVGTAGSLNMKNYIENFQNYQIKKVNVYDYSHGISELISLFLSIGMIFIAGKKSSIIISQCFIITLSVWFIFRKGLWQERLLIFCLEIVTSISFAISKLHVIENISTSHRCTIMGLISSCTSCITLFLFISLQILPINYYFCMFSALTLLTTLLSIFLFDDNSGFITVFTSK